MAAAQAHQYRRRVLSHRCLPPTSVRPCVRARVSLPPPSPTPPPPPPLPRARVYVCVCRRARASSTVKRPCRAPVRPRPDAHAVCPRIRLYRGRRRGSLHSRHAPRRYRAFRKSLVFVFFFARTTIFGASRRLCAIDGVHGNISPAVIRSRFFFPFQRERAACVYERYRPFPANRRHCRSCPLPVTFCVRVRLPAPRRKPCR